MRLVNGEVFFTVGEVAKFFGKSTPWVHYAESAGYWVYPNGTAIEYQRTPTGTRLFSAENIVRMASALVDRKIISGDDAEGIQTELGRFL